MCTGNLYGILAKVCAFECVFILYFTAETVHHQILSKQKLVLELEKDQKRLERMQRELQAIQAPLPDGGLEALTIEIEKLRNDCKLMAQHVEEAGPSYGWLFYLLEFCTFEIALISQFDE